MARLHVVEKGAPDPEPQPGEHVVKGTFLEAPLAGVMLSMEADPENKVNPWSVLLEAASEVVFQSDPNMIALNGPWYAAETDTFNLVVILSDVD